MRVTITLVLVAALPAFAFPQERRQPSGSRDAPSVATARKPGAGAASPAAELARALLPQERWDRLLDSYASRLSGQVSQALQSKGEQVPDGLEAKIRGELGERLRYQQTVDAQAQALSNQFTPDELRRTVRFYSTPTGKKVLEKLPEAQAEASQELQSLLATAVPEIVQRLAPKALAPSEAPQSSGEPGQEPPGAQGQPPEPQQR